MKIIIHLPAGKKQIKRLKRFLTELHSEMKPELKKEEATDDLISTFLDVSLHRVQIGKSTFSEYLGYCISLPDASRMKQLLKEWEKEDLLICTKPETKPGTERYPNSTKVHVEKNTHMTPPVFHAKPAPEFEHKNELPNYWEHTSPADAPVGPENEKPPFIPLFVGGHLNAEPTRKKQFRPKIFQKYFFFNNDFTINHAMWVGGKSDELRMKVGNCFETKEQCVNARGKIIDLLASI